MPPKTPLHVVGGNPHANPDEHPYRTAFIFSLITGVGAVLATMGVQAVVARARRRAEPEVPMFAPSPFAQPQMQLPPGGTWTYSLPSAAQSNYDDELPAALRFGPLPRTQTRRRERPMAAPANDSPPAWFVKFAKQQDARLKRLEASVVDDDDYEDESEAG